jgi:hypothetical protein
MTIGMQIPSSKVVLDSLMGLSSKSENLGIMPPMGCGSMGERKCVL